MRDGSPASLRRRLVLVTGKGGTGKSTVALAIALGAARTGRPVVLCEMGRPSSLRTTGVPHLVRQQLDPRVALGEWLARRVGRPGAALLMRSDVFAYFVAAAPGARELTTIGKAWDLTRVDPRSLIVVDAPSTGHALALLQAPQTFSELGRLGPVGREARQVRDSLRSRRETAVVVVTVPTDLAVAETIALTAGLRDILGRGPDLLVANMVLDRRFTEDEDTRVRDALAALPASSPPSVSAALRAAAAQHRRRAQQEEHLAQLARAVRRPDVVLPFVFAPQLHLADVEALGRRGLGGGEIRRAPAPAPGGRPPRPRRA